MKQVGMASLNQSIEAFVYFILSAKINVRSLILGLSESAKEAQRECLVLVEDAIRRLHISKRVYRFQLANDEANVRPDLVLSPGTRFMASTNQ